MQNKHRNFGVESLMIYITVTMLAVFLLETVLQTPIIEYLTLNRRMILQGQIWRLVTFIFVPPASRGFFLFIALYFYYFLGNTLEQYWGKFFFTVYYLIGMLGAIIAAMITGSANNTYLNLSLLLAFAQLFPDTEVLLFFIIPVKMKYIGLVNWIFFAMAFFTSLLQKDWGTTASLIAALANFFLFFGPDITKGIRENRRYAKRRREFKDNVRNFPGQF